MVKSAMEYYISSIGRAISGSDQKISTSIKKEKVEERTLMRINFLI
jgi:hypothetical protein